MLTERNKEQETLLEEKELNKGIYELLLSLAVSVVNSEPKLIPVVAKEIIKEENLDKLKPTLNLTS